MCWWASANFGYFATNSLNTSGDFAGWESSLYDMFSLLASWTLFNESSVTLIIQLANQYIYVQNAYDLPQCFANSRVCLTRGRILGQPRRTSSHHPTDRVRYPRAIGVFGEGDA
jgi:hypothetical protein